MGAVAVDESRIRDDSLRERVAAAPQERHLSENTLTAYRRGWLKLIAWSVAEGLALETLPEERAGIPRGGDPRTKRFHARQLHTQQNHKVTVPRSTCTAYPPARTLVIFSPSRGARTKISLVAGLRRLGE
jgi:hypothetical protein